MFSDLMIQIWESGDLMLGVWETVYMTLLSTAVAYGLGLPLGVLLHVSDEGGIRPIPWLNKILSVIVNVFRSIPFVTRCT